MWLQLNKKEHMKKNASLLMLLLLVAFAACSPDDPLQFNSPDGIYFNAPADSITYSFAKYPNRTTDTVWIPVSVLGNMSAQDRELNVEVVAGENAEAGKHYKLLTPYKISANKTTASIPVVVYRTGDMDSVLISLKLQLNQNNNFEIGINAKSTIKVRIAYLQKPPTWGDLSGIRWAGNSANFGTWTKTKYKIILNALYDQVSDTTIIEFPLTAPFPSSYAQYLQIVKNYIRTNYPGNYSATGATLRDPDMPNSPLILVGPANY
jgi:hypothetical protein